MRGSIETLGNVKDIEIRDLYKTKVANMTVSGGNTALRHSA